MIRQSVCFFSAASLVVLSLSVVAAGAQQQVPAAPAAQPAASASSAAPVFPRPDPANFTATSPSKEQVNAFLQANWGFDDTRVWQVQKIAKTKVEGISQVVVYVGDKTGKQKPAALQFFVLPDGKHAIAGDAMIPFGDKPFAEIAQIAMQGADGPYRGSAAKDLELVEFADFQCPHCKDAQANMEKLASRFSQSPRCLPGLSAGEDSSAGQESGGVWSLRGQRRAEATPSSLLPQLCSMARTDLRPPTAPRLP